MFNQKFKVESMYDLTDPKRSQMSNSEFYAHSNISKNANVMMNLLITGFVLVELSD